MFMYRVIILNFEMVDKIGINISVLILKLKFSKVLMSHNSKHCDDFEIIGAVAKEISLTCPFLFRKLFYHK